MSLETLVSRVINNILIQWALRFCGLLVKLYDCYSFGRIAKKL